MPFWLPFRSWLMRHGFLVTRRPRDMKQFFTRPDPSPLSWNLVISLFVSLAVKRRAKLPILSPRCPDNGVPVVSIPMQDGIRRNARPLMFEVFRRADHVGSVESVLTVVSAGISKDSVLLLCLERLSLKLCGIYLCFYFFSLSC